MMRRFLMMVLTVSRYPYCLNKALAVLNAAEREVVYLRVVEDMTTKEIAKALGCPHATVRTRLRRARNKVIEQYREGGCGEG